MYLVNKSDLDGASQLFDAVRDFIGASEKNPIIIKTSTKKNKGIADFAKKLVELMKLKKKEKKNNENTRLESELRDIILNNIKEKVDSMLDSNKTYSNYLTKLQSRKIDPFEAAEKIAKNLVK